MITRRGFIQSLGLATVAFSMDPERLLWVPGAKTIFIPESAGKVEIVDASYLDILGINQQLFSMMYSDPEDVLRDSEKYKANPFDLYYGNWHRHDIA